MSRQGEYWADWADENIELMRILRILYLDRENIELISYDNLRSLEKLRDKSKLGVEVS